MVGVRPEALGLSDGGTGIPATVALLEELGSETYVYATIDDRAVRTLDGSPVTLVARTPRRAPAKLGEQVRFRQTDPAVHLFAGATGERLGDGRPPPRGVPTSRRAGVPTRP